MHLIQILFQKLQFMIFIQNKNYESNRINDWGPYKNR